MDKISGILPSSHRIQSVDMKNAPALRPGAPSFGQPMGMTAVEDRVSLSSVAGGLARANAGAPGAIMDQVEALKPETWRDKDIRRAGIVGEVSAQFSQALVAPAAGGVDMLEREGRAVPEVRDSGTHEQTLRTISRQSEREALKPLARQKVAEFIKASESLEAATPAPRPRVQLIA